ncbi:MAG TPA: tetratricopeptide repeat protein [Longimicrobium sp.]|nr:tetratricopeptide repeat protein [Longimicrobium sp.]
MIPEFDDAPGRAPSLRAGRHLIMARRPEMAERELRGWLSLHPDDPHGHALLGWCLALQKRKEEAVAAAGEAVRLAPDWAYTHGVLAEVHLHVGQARQAEMSAREALALDPHHSGYYGLLSAALLNQPLRFRTGEALKAAEAGLAADAGDADCARLRAQALLRLGRRREAREAAAYALEKAPDASETHAAAGWIELAAGGSRERSRAHLREALRMDPMNHDAVRGLRIATQGSRFAAALVMQVEEWGWRLALVALAFAAEMAAVVAWAGPSDTRFVLAYALFTLGSLEGAMLYVRYRRPRMLAELRFPGALTPGERRDARGVLMLGLGFLLLLPLGMLLD